MNTNLCNLGIYRQIIGYDLTTTPPTRVHPSFCVPSEDRVYVGALKYYTAQGNPITVINQDKTAYAMIDLNSDFRMQFVIRNRVAGKALTKVVKEVNPLPQPVATKELVERGWVIQ